MIYIVSNVDFIDSELSIFTENNTHMYFTGSYLRVITPKTTNGIIPQIIDGEAQYNETFLPLSARKQLEAKNRRLLRNGFKHLAMEIEVVGEIIPSVVIKKRGPKPKNQ